MEIGSILRVVCVSATLAREDRAGIQTVKEASMTDDQASSISRFLTDYTPATPESIQRMNEVRDKYADLANWVQENIDPSDQKAAGMRDLLRAKDCHVRAVLD